ncbi:MAG: hypothetical protein ABI208_08070 [Ginsengibacter sp.]|jgi:hypothetical protein
MMKNEKEMTEMERLELISSMINKAKNNFAENGVLYLLWGWVILVCCITQFIAVHFFNYPYAHFVWFLTWIVVLFQIFYLKKKKKLQKARTYTNEINSMVWLVFFICMMLMVFISLQLKNYEMINPLLLVLYGVPTFLSGVIMKFKPLIFGGICCWVLSIISPFILYEYQMLLIAAAVIAAWIIPGYLLQKKYKKEN